MSNKFEIGDAVRLKRGSATIYISSFEILGAEPHSRVEAHCVGEANGPDGRPYVYAVSVSTKLLTKDNA